MKKLLSDGTVAKKGMIVSVINGINCGNNAKAIVAITDLRDRPDCSVNTVGCEYDNFPSKYFLKYTMIERIEDLRKATSKERKVRLNLIKKWKESQNQK